MTDKNFSVIKPVENLNNIANLKPIQERRKRKKDRRQENSDGEKKTETNLEESSHSIEEDITKEIHENDGEKHTIDYRA
jgi:hypothetical protein